MWSSRIFLVFSFFLVLSTFTASANLGSSNRQELAKNALIRRKINTVPPTPTASPIRRADDFLIDNSKNPEDNAAAVGTIIETEIEEELLNQVDVSSNPNGSPAPDVLVRIKIKTRGNGGKRKSKLQEPKGMVRAFEYASFEDTPADENKLVSDNELNVRNWKYMESVVRPLRYCLPLRRCALRVIVTTPGFVIERNIFEKVLEKMKQMESLSTVFKVNKKWYKLKEKKGEEKKYFINLFYKASYLGKLTAI